jgi:hypothetical protein
MGGRDREKGGRKKRKGKGRGKEIKRDGER